MDFHIVIPARFASTRLPGKVLLDIAGKPMLQHVYERSVESGAGTVVIATDDEKVANSAESFGAKVCMTSPLHHTGTERLSEAVDALELESDDIVIGVQADEPLIDPQAIRYLAEDLEEHKNVKVVSLCEPVLDIEELFDRDVVKVVLNKRGHAVYFSRAAIPWDREHFKGEQDADVMNGPYYRHVGIYGYRVGFLNDYMEWGNCPLEDVELLEQLRIIWNGGRIYMRVLPKKVAPGVNTQADLDKVRSLFAKK